MRAVLQINKLIQRTLADQEHRHRAHEHRADGQAQHDDDDVVGDGERADHAVKAERGVQHFQVQEAADAAARDRFDQVAIAAFGWRGAFLLLVFLNFLFDDEKELHWLGWAEEKVNALGTESLAVLITMGAVAACVAMGPADEKYSVLAAGSVGIAVYIGVDWISGLLEEKEGAGAPALGKAVSQGSIGGFLYLEVLDASFSFDGVIGAFAITNDVVIIMLGLAIGAMFVRSMTVYLVRQGTLDEFVYLEHGAHYAIGILAVIMLVSMHMHVPELITGGVGPLAKNYGVNV